MIIKNGKEKEYKKFIEINSKDIYSYGVVKYMIAWADLMEKHINSGEDIQMFAEATSHEAADTEGITGFMYGCAVHALSEFWEHGEELRKWHNSKYNYYGEGTVNPAILTTR